jgi:hypothetical protein
MVGIRKQALSFKLTKLMAADEPGGTRLRAVIFHTARSHPGRQALSVGGGTFQPRKPGRRGIVWISRIPDDDSYITSEMT